MYEGTVGHLVGLLDKQTTGQLVRRLDGLLVNLIDG